MKTKINLFKLFILLFGISLFLWNCEGESYINQDNQAEYRINEKTYSELFKKVKFKKAMNKLTQSRLSNRNTDYDFEIDSTSIKEIEYGNVTTFTFGIIRDIDDPDSFENLVITVDSLENVTTMLFKYLPSEEVENIDFHNTFTFQGQAEISLLDADNENSARTLTETCYQVTTIYCTELGGSYTSLHIANSDCQNDEYKFPVTHDVCYTSGSDQPVIVDVSGGGGDGAQVGGGATLPDNPDNLPQIITSTVNSSIDYAEQIINCFNVEELGSSNNVTLNPAQLSWVNAASPRNLIPLNSFLQDNTCSNDAQIFGMNVIDSEIEETLLTVSPFVKYPPGSDYESLYPKLTEYLKNQIPKVGDIPIIVNSIKKYTNLSIDEIKEQLKWGNGPTIKIEQLGSTVGGPIHAEFRRDSDPNSLYLDIDLVNQLENSTPGSELAEAFTFWIGVCVLHEFVHYGDYNYNSNSWVYPQEEGLLFEIDVYGHSVWMEDGKILIR